MQFTTNLGTKKHYGNGLNMFAFVCGGQAMHTLCVKLTHRAPSTHSSLPCRAQVVVNTVAVPFPFTLVRATLCSAFVVTDPFVVLIYLFSLSAYMLSFSLCVFLPFFVLITLSLEYDKYCAHAGGYGGRLHNVGCLSAPGYL